MKLVTWNTQWCRGLDGIVSPRRIVEGARAMADFDVLCLQEIASGYEAMPGAPGRPAGRAARAAAGLPALLRRRGGRIRPRGPAAALRQSDRDPPAGVAGPAPSAALAGRPVRDQHAAHVHGADAEQSRTGSAARDDHAPRVLLAEAARGAGAGPARAARRGLRAGGGAAEGRLRRLAFPAQAAHAAGHPLRRLQHGRRPGMRIQRLHAPTAAAERPSSGCRMPGRWCTATRRTRPPSGCSTAGTARIRWPTTSCSSAKAWRRACAASRSTWRRAPPTTSPCASSSAIEA